MAVRWYLQEPIGSLESNDGDSGSALLLDLLCRSCPRKMPDGHAEAAVPPLRAYAHPHVATTAPKSQEAALGERALAKIGIASEGSIEDH